MDFDIRNYQGLIIYEISDVKFCSDITKVSNILKINSVDLPSGFNKKKIVPISINKISSPLVNVQQLLKLPTTSITNFSRILLYESEAVKFYFIVSKIHHIVTVDRIFRKTSEVVEPSVKYNYLIGALSIEGVEHNIPDLESIGKELVKNRKLNDK